MNYVVLVYASVATIFMGMFGFLWWHEQRDRERVEANLRTERDDALLQCAKLKSENGELVALDADLSEALEKTRVLYNNILAKNAEIMRTVEIPKRPTRKKAGGE